MTSPERTPAAARRPMRPTDLHRLRAVGEVEVHPDGRSAVFAVTRPDPDLDINRSDLHSIDVDGGNHRVRTGGPKDTRPRFSPDGSRMAFVRTPDGPSSPSQLATMAWPIGEITVVTSFDAAPVDLAWMDDATLAVLVPHRAAEVDAEEAARRPKITTTINYRFNARGYLHDRPQQIFVLDVASGSTTPVGPTDRDHLAMAVSPDGRFVAAAAGTDPDHDLSGTIDLWRYSVDGSSEPVRLTDPGGVWRGVAWHPDGELLAVGASDAARVGYNRLHRVATPAGDRAAFTPQVEAVGEHDLNLMPGTFDGRQLIPVPGGVLAPGVRRGRVAVDRYDLADRSRTVIHDEPEQVKALHSDGAGTAILAAVTSPTRPAELYRLGSSTAELTDLNRDVLAEIEVAEMSTVLVPSTDGVEVEAFITRPPTSAPTAATDGRPGLVYVHGGPMFQYGHYFFDEFQMAAATGYVVIGGNPRGSDGYGEQWARSIVGDLGNKDFADVSALADHLEALPEVDADRIGIGGGSYGGFMTGWALSHDPAGRYKAGLVERAVTSWTTMYGTSDIGHWFTSSLIEATIDGDAAEVARQSPLTHAARISAPTLIIHSEEDWRCPIEQAEQLFAAIRRNGGDAVFVRFPGENHELSRSGKPRHRVERLEIVHEFYARHLGGAHFDSSHLDKA